MPTLLSDCPRCGATKSTFDVLANNPVASRYLRASWHSHYEAYCVCRHCHTGTVFVLVLINQRLADQGELQNFWKSSVNLNDHFEPVSFISIKDFNKAKCPEHVPEQVKTAFDEAAASLAIGAHNAACAMFRASIDLATKDLIPPAGTEGGPTDRQRKTLFTRIQWLIGEGRISQDLEDLATCIREDGNDGVHECSLGEDDANDNLDFTEALLRRLYTEPTRVLIAQDRRSARRQDTSK